MTVLMFAFWGFLIWAVLAVARGERPAPTGSADPEALLSRWFAAGEIDEDDYRARLDTLRATRDHAPPPASGVPS